MQSQSSSIRQVRIPCNALSRAVDSKHLEKVLNELAREGYGCDTQSFFLEDTPRPFWLSSVALVVDFLPQVDAAKFRYKVYFSLVGGADKSKIELELNRATAGGYEVLHAYKQTVRKFPFGEMSAYVFILRYRMGETATLREYEVLESGGSLEVRTTRASQEALAAVRAQTPKTRQSP